MLCLRWTSPSMYGYTRIPANFLIHRWAYPLQMLKQKLPIFSQITKYDKVYLSHNRPQPYPKFLWISWQFHKLDKLVCLTPIAPGMIFPLAFIYVFFSAE